MSFFSAALTSTLSHQVRLPFYKRQFGKLGFHEREGGGERERERDRESGSFFGSGFSLACEDLGRMFDNSFPACAFFFFKVEISSRKLIPLFRPVSYTHLTLPTRRTV